MKPLAEEIFLQEIGSQILGARRAMDRLRQATRNGDAEAAYHDVADFLNHAALVSKILNPSKKAGSQASLRGEYLCGVLKIEKSEIALGRKLRNHLEHIDERLDKWIDTNNPNIYIDRGLTSAALLFNVEPIRHLNANTNIYRFLGEEFNLGVIEISLNRIFNAAAARSRLLKVPGHGRDPLREQSQLYPDHVK